MKNRVLLLLSLSVIFLSGCEFVEEKALKEAIDEGNIKHISENLYSGKKEIWLRSDTSSRNAEKRWEMFCQRKGKKSYILSRITKDNHLHYTFACLANNDIGTSNNDLRKAAANFFMNRHHIRNTGKYISTMEGNESSSDSEKIANSYCSKIGLIMLPQFYYGSGLTFACISNDDKSAKVMELKAQAKEYEEKRHNRKMEELQGRLLYEQQIQNSQPKYVPTTKTDCKRKYSGELECTTYDSSNPFGKYGY
jgi:hypothetical protein